MSIERLRDEGVRAVALVFLDTGGTARMKCVALDRLAHAAGAGLGWSEVWGLALADDTFAHPPDLYNPSGDVRLRADASAARVIGSSPGWGWAPVDHVEQDGAPWPGCQRTFLRRMVDRAEASGVEVRAAWELEWVAGAETPDGFEPLHRGPGYGAATFGTTGPVILDLFDALAASGVVPPQIHPEYAHGQMEMSLPVNDPIGACDDALLVRHVIRDVCADHGLRASFSPRVIAGSVGNGAHVHFSLWRDGEPQFAGGSGPEGLTRSGEAFLAGVLSHLPALTSLGNPIGLSYVRLVPQHWAGAYCCWGNENREAALRLEGTGGRDLGVVNVEWKSVDGAASPYLALGGVIAAGLSGIERELSLPAPVSADPAALAADELAHLGIARLPVSLGEAAELLAVDETLREALGPYLHDRLVAVRREQAVADGALDEAALVERYRWRF